jgi:para-nitrobenzyl esterase
MKKGLLICATLLVYTLTSAQTRFRDSVFASIKVDSNVAYGTNNTFLGVPQNLVMDIYQPEGDTANSRPVIVIAHGGSFINGDRRLPDVVHLCKQFAKRGYVTASIQYRQGINPFSGLGYEIEFTQAVWRGQQDGRAAVRFLRKHAATGNSYKINPEIIYFAGVSAGGVLGLQMTFLDKPSELEGLGVDTTLLGGFEGNTGNTGYSSGVSAIANLSGALKNVSWMLDKKTVPLCHVHGDQDQTVPYGSADFYYMGNRVSFLQGSFSIDSAAKLNGINSRLLTFKGQDHVPFSFNASYMDTTVKYVADFFYGVYTGAIVSSVGRFPIKDIGVSVYPNPASTFLQVILPKSVAPQRYTLTDLNGKVIESGIYPDSNNKLDVSSIAEGLYLLNLYTEQSVYNKRILIRH